MEGVVAVHLFVLSLLGLYLRCLCQEDAAVYIVTMKQPSAAHYYDQVKRFGSSGVSAGASGAFNTLNKPRSFLFFVFLKLYYLPLDIAVKFSSQSL